MELHVSKSVLMFHQVFHSSNERSGKKKTRSQKTAGANKIGAVCESVVFGNWRLELAG